MVADWLSQLIDVQAKQLLSMLRSEPGFLIGLLLDFVGEANVA
jgi:hypothetical protein